MNDVRDEPLGAILERAAIGLESAPTDRLPEVLRRGSRMRATRFTAISAAVAVFAGAVSWAGLQNEDRGTIPANIADWDTFASLEENGWTVQVPPSWRVQELPACENAPERIGMIVTNVDFEFLDPRGESPQCEDRFVFHGFPSEGVAFAFMPVGIRFGIFRQPYDTVLPLAPELLHQTDGIKGGPAASFLGIWARRSNLAYVRRWEGPEASAGDVAALDRILSSLRVRGVTRWVEGRARSLGDVGVSFLRPDTWSFAGYPHAIVIDAPTPILRLRSPGIRLDGCELPGTPWIQVGRLNENGIEIVVSDASESFGPPDLPTRLDPFGFADALRRRWVTCRGDRLRVSTFGFEDAGKPIYVDVIASTSADRNQPEMLLYILNSIRIEEA